MVYAIFKYMTCRPNRGAMKSALIGLLLTFATTPVFALDDPLLSRLEGNWFGQGMVRLKPTSSPERIFCKIANKLVDEGQVLVQKGRCAVANNFGSVKGKIAAVGDGRYEGSLKSPQSVGLATLAGQAVEDKIVLSAEFIDRLSRRTTLSIISLIVGDGDEYRFISNTLNAESGSHFQTSDIIFKPNKKKPKRR